VKNDTRQQGYKAGTGIHIVTFNGVNKLCNKHCMAIWSTFIIAAEWMDA
jgi:hypothetical protein